jgi:hypothetical protein
MVMSPRIAALLLLAFFALASSAQAETVFVEADRDATLIEDPAGATANGSGPYFFVGRTNQAAGSIRRTVLRFDVASALPAKAIVESASVTLYLAPSNLVPIEIRLQRLLADWSEGPSSASGGGGRDAEPGDVTWLHTDYDVELWNRAGGHFIGRVSARLEVGDTDFYTWESNPHLVQDVRLWKSAPSRNFGWILISDEATPQTAKSFASRENADSLLRPVLRVTYRLPGDRGGR